MADSMVAGPTGAGAQAGATKGERRPEGPLGLSMSHNPPQRFTTADNAERLGAVSQSWPEIDTTAVGFRGREAVDIAAAMWERPETKRRPPAATTGLWAVTDVAPVQRVLRISPGVLQVTVRDLRTKDRPDQSLLIDDQDHDGCSPVRYPDDDHDGVGGGVVTRGVITEFTAESRMRLARRCARIDWPEAINTGERLAMVTLTYPGDWRAACPDPAAMQRHFDSLVKRYGRATGTPLRCVWVREFQRRGAPHIHLLAPLPLRIGDRSTAAWFLNAWADIVASGDPLHAKAGTRIDWNQGLDRMTDPKRIAIYFSGYSTTDTKGYQHTAPEGWANPDGSIGRWWGVRHLDTCDAEVEITAADMIELARAARRIIAATGRTKQLNVQRINQETGEIRYRKLTRRYRLRSLSRRQGVTPGGRDEWTGRTGTEHGFTLFANDVPLLATQLARMLQDRPRWPPGARRPLP